MAKKKPPPEESASSRGYEERWRSIVESAVDGIVVIDKDGCVEAFNPAAERLFGYSEAEVLGRNVNMLMPAPYHAEHDDYLRRYLSTGEARIIGIGREVTGLRRDGQTFPLHLSVGEMVIGGERKFTGILHDLSRRVRMEERLREQTALARIGEMAAVIAHEVKNPLAGMRGALQVIGDRLPADGPDRSIVQEIVARIDALNDMVKDLLLFARPPQPRPSPVDVRDLLAGTARLLRNDPGASDVDIVIEGTAPVVLADAEMLKIVFLNLMANSAHAMAGRGVVRISIGVDEGFCRIRISDNGPGIPLEARDKVFTPFFTTKSRGTGLGLPTAKRLIEAHEGTLRLECPPDGGTTVVIQLPAVAASSD